MSIRGLWTEKRERHICVIYSDHYLYYQLLSEYPWVEFTGHIVKSKNELWPDSEKIMEEELCQW